MNAAIYNNTLIPVVTPFFDAESNTFSYVVKDPSSAACAVIDSVLDLDYASGGISHEGADAIIKFIRDNDLKDRVDHRDACACRPYFGRPLHSR